MADGDDDNPVVIVCLSVTLFFVISALIVLIFVACFKRWLDLRRNNHEDDRGQLERRDVEADGHSRDNSRNGYANPTIPDVQTSLETFTAHEIPSINRLLPLRKATTNRPDTVRVPVPDNQNNHSIYTISGGHQQRRSQSIPGRIAEGKSIPDFKKLQDLQFILKDKAVILDTMREAQLIMLLRRQQAPPEESLQTTLVIGVDATPKAYGGYCVNLRTKSLEFYIIKAKELPWSVQDQNDPKWQIEEGVDLLCQYYGIEGSNVRGTYQLTKPANEGSNPWFDPTGFHSHTALLLFLIYRRKFGFNLTCCQSNVEENSETKVSVTGENLPIINQIPQPGSSYHIENEIQRDVSNSLNVCIDDNAAFTSQLYQNRTQIPPQVVLDQSDDRNGSIKELNLSVDPRDARAEEHTIDDDKNEISPSLSFSEGNDDGGSDPLSPVSSLPLDEIYHDANLDRPEKETDEVNVEITNYGGTDPRSLRLGPNDMEDDELKEYVMSIDGNSNIDGVYLHKLNAKTVHIFGGEPSRIATGPATQAQCILFNEPKPSVESQNKTFSIETKILELQENLNKSNSLKTVRLVQDLLLKLINTSEESPQSELIIGVDSTPRIQAGYCVNLEDKSLQYYVVKRQDLPWVLHGDNVSAEFEMKNFIFALTVWKGYILKYKRIRIYTDNFSINHPKARYGGRASTLLEHYANCENVVIINRSDIAVNRFKNLKYFAKYIQPADDFSRWHIREAVEFLKQLYGIHDESIYGTHIQENFETRKPWYGPTPLYQRILQKAEDVIRIRLCSDPNCSRLLKLSLRIKRNAVRVRKIH